MKQFVLSVLCLCLSWGVLARPVEVVFWHSMAGQLGRELNQLVDEFNRSQPEYHIRPVYKGDYLECLTSFAAAFQAKRPPDLVQVFEVGTQTLLAPRGIIKPVYELMQEQGLSLPETSMFPLVKQQYSQHGRLMAMPFNLSIPVLFYNQAALRKAGYDAQSFPKTWDELESLAAKLRKSGYACAYTTAYPAWILLESYAALHDLSLFRAEDSTQVSYDHPLIMAHLERLRRWQKLHYFEYGGRMDDATVLFTSGRCPLYSHSSGVYSSLTEIVAFPVGMSALPIEANQLGKRHHNVAGGAAIWAVADKPPSVYQGIARFFIYLARPDVQMRWHQNTGYLPLGITGIYEHLATHSQHPALNLARQELGDLDRQTLNRGDFSMQNQIRMINDEAFEAIFSGIKGPKAAMAEAALRAEHALRRFKQNTTSNDLPATKWSRPIV